MFEDGGQFIWGADVVEVCVETHGAAIEGVKSTSAEDGSLMIEVGHYTVHIGLLVGAALDLPRYPASYGIAAPAAA